MRLTIIADDQRVGVDNEFFEPIDLSALDQSIHAVQWYGEYGEVEFKAVFENGVFSKPQNQFITDVAPYQFAIDAWQAAKDTPTVNDGEIPVTEV